VRADVSSALGYLESHGTTSPARGVLGLYGEQDLRPSPGGLDEWEQQLAAVPVAAELVQYPDAGHAFDVEEAAGPGMPVPCVAGAANHASECTLRFLEKSLHPYRTAPRHAPGAGEGTDGRL
jgi:dienelactone hydrolase